MKFSTHVPDRKRKKVRNPVTDDPAFARMLKAVREGSIEQAALVFGPDDAKTLKIAHPWRVAADHLRRIIKDEKLPYRVNKYQMADEGRAVRVVRMGAMKTTEVGAAQRVKSA